MIILDLTTIDTKEELHLYLKEMLMLPEHYGKNLDALYDVLTEISQPLELVLEGSDILCEKISGYGKLFLTVVMHAARENENLTVILKGCGE